MTENIIDAMQTSTVKPMLHSAASRRARFVVLALALILVGAAAISLLLGRYPIDPAQAVAMLVSKIVPVDPIWTEQQATLAALARRAWSLKRTLDTTEETSHAFLLPAALMP